MKIAVIEAGGKQYLVKEDQTLRIEKLVKGANVPSIKSVLLVADNDKVNIGTPDLSLNVVTAERLGDGRAKKVIVEKFKSKVRYHKKQGHRQSFSTLKINKISV